MMHPLPHWTTPAVAWLEEMLSENYGVSHRVESLVAGTGLQDTWTAVVSDKRGGTGRWFLRKVSSTARWCTISAAYSALDIPTMRPIPFDHNILAYPAVEGMVLTDYRPESKTALLELGSALGAAFIPPLLTELGDRRPGNMILSESSSGDSYHIVHIDFDKSLYMPWYKKIVNRRSFIKHLCRRLVSPWVVDLDIDTRTAFFERFTVSAEKSLHDCLIINIQAPEDLMCNYLKEIFPSMQMDLPWDSNMLKFTYKQLSHWEKIGATQIRQSIARLLQV